MDTVSKLLNNMNKNLVNNEEGEKYKLTKLNDFG